MGRFGRAVGGARGVGSGAARQVLPGRRRLYALVRRGTAARHSSAPRPPAHMKSADPPRPPHPTTTTTTTTTTHTHTHTPHPFPSQVWRPLDILRRSFGADWRAVPRAARGDGAGALRLGRLRRAIPRGKLPDGHDLAARVVVRRRPGGGSSPGAARTEGMATVRMDDTPRQRISI